MKYREIARRLRELGCEYVRDGAGSHRIWWNPATGGFTTLPDWGAKDIKPGTVRRALSDLGLTRSEFGSIKLRCKRVPTLGLGADPDLSAFCDMVHRDMSRFSSARRLS